VKAKYPKTGAKNNAKLIVLNYSMDSADPIFGHQQQIVLELSKHWSEIHVITGRSGKLVGKSNVFVYDTDWLPDQNFRNILNFIKVFFRVISATKPNVIFSHMTEVQSSIVAIYCKCKGLKHYLWYAHASSSKYLRFVSRFATGIITSTPGSCPLSGEKVIVIGQSIDEKQFKQKYVRSEKLLRFVHFGRLDESKGIQEMIDSLSAIRIAEPDITLSFIGNPSNQRNAVWAEGLKSRYSAEKSWLEFHPAVSRSDLPAAIANYDLMLHAFRGSLDKTLVEATMVGIPVATVNLEYIRIFGHWGGHQDLGSIALPGEISAIIGLNQAQLELELNSRRLLAIKKHSMSNWILKLNQILMS
jgi:glycosyltransferase involved in cell wall biosynthesis